MPETNNKIYIVIATNMYGVDEAPVLTTNVSDAVKEMERLMVWGINERLPSIIDEYSDLTGIDVETLSDYDEMEKQHLTDNFFKWLSESKSDIYKDKESCIRIRLGKTECDVFEVGYWEQDYPHA